MDYIAEFFNYYYYLGLIATLYLCHFVGLNRWEAYTKLFILYFTCLAIRSGFGTWHYRIKHNFQVDFLLSKHWYSIGSSNHGNVLWHVLVLGGLCLFRALLTLQYLLHQPDIPTTTIKFFKVLTIASCLWSCMKIEWCYWVHTQTARGVAAWCPILKTCFTFEACGII